MAKQIWSLSLSFIIASLLQMYGMSPSLAQQDELTRAEVYKLLNNVQLLLRNKPARPAKKADVLAPRDALQTAARARAELLFNEGSLARIDQSTTFLFKPGLRRFQLTNRVATETVLQLKDGIALVINPPGSAVTTVETPTSTIQLQSLPTPAAPGSPAAPPLSPSQGSSAVMVVYNAATNTAQHFALTDGVTIATPTGSNPVSLKGGQVVVASAGGVGNPVEFDLQGFYSTITLAAGLGPGQESIVAQESYEVQQTLNFVRIDTLAAVRNQVRRISSFEATFLRDALTGGDSNFDGQKGKTSVLIFNPSVTTGVFTRTGENTATFTATNGTVSNISVDFDTQSTTINNNAGVSNSVGLSGNNASATVINANGTVTKIQVFGVGGKEPNVGSSFPGTLTTGIAPDS
ncbi:hypothetical protein [Coleofasciculus sp. FACHB-1120]|uniref:hypothetical protein n=1 Tax=Coleofasciculus sp. FACHB-1120 TaxID=2692783 RepID=UPI001686E3CD|nr:hypothetical protein [Coleofasciculus sp. FACHB-1120]MBD2744513.1 hypothetical protein [Coleofasciculus sp. FACHB-1120]